MKKNDRKFAFRQVTRTRKCIFIIIGWWNMHDGFPEMEFSTTRCLSCYAGCLPVAPENKSVAWKAQKIRMENIQRQLIPANLIQTVIILRFTHIQSSLLLCVTQSWRHARTFHGKVQEGKFSTHSGFSAECFYSWRIINCESDIVRLQSCRNEQRLQIPMCELSRPNLPTLMCFGFHPTSFLCQFQFTARISLFRKMSLQTSLSYHYAEGMKYLYVLYLPSRLFI